MKILKDLAVTISFVTCFPLARSTPERYEADHAGLAKYLPAAGIFIGALLNAIFWLAQQLHTGAMTTSLLLVFAWLVFTGAMHVDGLMDTADGVFSHRDRSRMLEIMSDSRTGNFGVIAGILLILTKFTALSCLPPDIMPVALLLVPVWARFAQNYTIGAFPYLRSQGMGKIWHKSTRMPADLIAAALLTFLVTGVAATVGGISAVFISLFTGVSGIVAARLIARVLGGHTGDSYGAVVEIAEAAGLVLSSLSLSLG